MSTTMERTTIAGDIEIPRMINGLWQLADMKVDIPNAAKAMDSLIASGLSCFDMADHYGDAELVIGKYNGRPAVDPRSITAFTKWCPQENGITTFEHAEAAVDLALSRMGQKRIALMQYHIWDYTDDTYLQNLAHLQKMADQGKLGAVGLTNTDAAHLELLLRSGYRIATNQVSCSVIDRRLVRGRLGAVCAEHGVGILAYGTLLGGYLSEKWVGAPEPTDEAALNWSLRKYLRFIRAAGGWAAFQGVLQALAAVAGKHKVSIPAVATRWVLDIPVVKAVIVGSRLTPESDKYTASNLSAFSFSLDQDDVSLISKAQEALADIPGDNGDEYRRPPFLTASGDLSHHIHGSADRIKALEEAVAQGSRIEYHTGSKWEPIAGYSRAVRVGNVIRVSGTTANPPPPLTDSMAAIGGKSARCQTTAILDIIARSVKALGGSTADIVRTRVMVRNEEDCEEVSEAHGWVFGCEKIRPSNTLVTTSPIGDAFLVEIEAVAVVGSSSRPVVIISQ
ncbi:NADP-dependent oxidoreductase domain-containing protein [Microdochium trichocladiopsis]|uniref:NADP-dependent oxidoreductase domain-containing protein n=1 Tax=Microdochium trichocladiopsis TaxID=1682393 RepID=A0A9P8Y0X1_9PEZI|nr:NADP-dependent oxidoreductase domain-containing protein [Microdochium trichocladiopsis]KAH7024816.1 NADP-dependent oxidoreductase domain-containing protein [Microdochium trichocladiopsis]